MDGNEKSRPRIADGIDNILLTETASALHRDECFLRFRGPARFIFLELWVRHDERTGCQVVNVAEQKRPDGIGWRADDRLFVHVEAGVDQHRDAGPLFVRR